ncbi:acyl-CoA thioester hydrolase [Tamilnaduibacter salinus]|uniref:Acyl-CoA thioester hydrolase n=1 Tax=Tamilnaduibacter salinus TaxID=1484056 RepID=A0A2U1CWR3_9GAMM|nr:thioesterase family protein [Tamilnaduibacter salinus]PVY76428.1 acyl-CoA thioester hydrolase [Tamilnaduibacter salinus]
MAPNDTTQPLTLDDFPSRTYDKLRYADTDRQGHVNNALFSTFLETGRVEFLYSPDDPLASDGASFVIANLNLQLRSEITWPGTVDIGTAITRIGNSSIQLLQGIFQNGTCAATAETVIVQMNDESRSSHPLSEATRTKLAQYQISRPE